MLVELLFVAGLAAGHGLLAGAETAIFEVKASRVRDLLARGVAGARELDVLRGRPERMLSTTRSTMALLAALAGVAGGFELARGLEPTVAGLPVLTRAPRAVAGTLAVAVIALLFVTLGHLVPQAVASRAPERWAARAARLVAGLARLVGPVAWLASTLSDLILRPFGMKASFAEPLLSEASLHANIDEASKTGTVDPRAGVIARRAIDFGRLTAEDVMVPRVDVVAIPVKTSIDDLHRTLMETGHSRLPVYGASIDEILGYISAKDVLALSVERALFVVQDLIRPAFFVPVSMRATTVLEELRARGVHLAFVTDAAGGLAGIVTMEDLLEELVGDIFSEHDHRPSIAIQHVAEGTLVVEGTVPVREVNRALEVLLPESDDWSTVAGLCIALAGRIPQAGERIQSEDGTVLEILSASNQRVRSVRVSRLR